MQEVQMPNGDLLREFFTEDEVRRGKHTRRRKELEKLGGKFKRFEWVATSKYTPHQGQRECERRRRQMARACERVQA